MTSGTLRLPLILLVAGALAGPALAGSDPTPPPAKLVLNLGSTRYRHPAFIELSALGPDGRTLFTLSEKGVYAWDLTDGSSRRVFEGKRVRNSLQVSPDGKRLLTISGDSATVLDATTGQEIKWIEDNSSPSYAAYRPDGTGVILFGDGHIDYLGADGVDRRLRNTGDFCVPVFSTDGKWFAAAAPGERPREVVIYDAQALEKKCTVTVGRSGFGPLPYNSLPTVRAAFSPDGNLFAFPGNSEIRVWDVSAEKEVRTLKSASEERDWQEGEYLVLLFGKDGKRLFAGTAGGTLRWWDVESGKELAPLRAHRSGIITLNIARDGRQLVSTDAEGSIRRWDVAAGREIEPPNGYSGSLHARVSPDGQSALLLDANGQMDLHDLDGHQPPVRVRPAGKADIDTPWLEPLFGFLPDRRRVFLAETTGKVTVFETTGGTKASGFELKGYTDRGHRLRFCVAAPDGRSFAVNRGARRIALIDAATGKDVWESPDRSPRGMCYYPVFTPDGKKLFSGVTTYEERAYSELQGKLELVRLDAATGKVIDRAKIESKSTGDLSWFEQPLLTPDGRTLALPYWMIEVSVVDAAANKVLHFHSISSTRFAVSPDGKWLVGADRNAIRMYDTTTGKELYSVPVGDQIIESLHVLPDGRRVLATGRGGLACVWDLTPALSRSAPPQGGERSGPVGPSR
jgi:WD40 repeat protein